jgi:hypothetical protein
MSKFRTALIAGLSLAAVSTAAFADRAEEERDCTSDALKFCSSEI